MVGTPNVADLMSTALGGSVVDKHVESLGAAFQIGRAEVAASISMCLASFCSEDRQKEGRALCVRNALVGADQMYPSLLKVFGFRGEHVAAS